VEWDDDIFKNKLKKNPAHRERERDLGRLFKRTQTHCGLTEKNKTKQKTHATAAFDVVFLFAPNAETELVPNTRRLSPSSVFARSGYRDGNICVL